MELRTTAGERLRPELTVESSRLFHLKQARQLELVPVAPPEPPPEIEAQPEPEPQAETPEVEPEEEYELVQQSHHSGGARAGLVACQFKGKGPFEVLHLTLAAGAHKAYRPQ